MLVAIAAALPGLAVGSFLNVVIHRLPVMLDRDWKRQCREMLAPGEPAPAESVYNLATPPSACPACSAPIRARHNVPVLGWLVLRGRCADCGARISPRYPLVEAFTGLATVLVVLRFGLTLECLGALLLTWSLIAISGIDLDHQLLPDAITLPLLWLGLFFALLGESGHGYRVLAGLEASVIGAMAGYLSLWCVYHAFRLATGKEGMGYGDFKLLAALGAWLGWQSLPLIILISAFVGATTGIALIVVRGRDRQLPLPFGPFLAAAGFVALMWGGRIVGAYRDLSGL